MNVEGKQPKTQVNIFSVNHSHSTHDRLELKGQPSILGYPQIFELHASFTLFIE